MVQYAETVSRQAEVLVEKEEKKKKGKKSGVAILELLELENNLHVISVVTWSSPISTNRMPCRHHCARHELSQQ
jgi:hypothetical protein